MNEREFSKKLRASLRAGGLLATPIETGGTAAGFPDLFVCGGGVLTFIEVKSRPRQTLASLARNPDIEGQGQESFARQVSGRSRLRLGDYIVFRHAFLIVSCSDGVLLYRQCVHGKEAAFSWMEGEGRAHPATLAMALRSYAVSCVPSSRLKGRPMQECIEGAAAIYMMHTGIPVAPEAGKWDGMKMNGADDAARIGCALSKMGLYALVTQEQERMDSSHAALPLEDGGSIIL